MQKKREKQLTAPIKCDNICELSKRGALRGARAAPWKKFEKTWKSAEKQLTTVSVCDKIAKLSEADVRNAGRSSSDEKNLKKLQKAPQKQLTTECNLWYDMRVAASGRRHSNTGQTKTKKFSKKRSKKMTKNAWQVNRRCAKIKRLSPTKETATRTVVRSMQIKNRIRKKRFFVTQKAVSVNFLSIKVLKTKSAR